MGRPKKEEIYTSLKETSLEERNELTKRYEPLMNKITKQMYSKNAGKIGWDDIKSMAYEGLVLAMNTYDPDRKTKDGKPLSFTQFAAWAILNNIRTRLSEECRTVRMSAYMQAKAVENGGTAFESVGFDDKNDDGDDVNSSKIFNSLKNTLYATPKWEDGDVESFIYMRIEQKFTQADSELFYRFYGMKGYEEEKVLDLAKELNVTSGRISQRITKIVKYIKTQSDICEAIAKLYGLEV